MQLPPLDTQSAGRERGGYLSSNGLLLILDVTRQPHGLHAVGYVRHWGFQNAADDYLLNEHGRMTVNCVSLGELAPADAQQPINGAVLVLGKGMFENDDLAVRDRPVGLLSDDPVYRFKVPRALVLGSR